MLRIHPEADVEADVEIGDSSTVWGLAQVRTGARLGEECVVGRGAYIGVGVHIGDRVKIQNLAQIYEPAHIEDESFIGPAVVLTNDQHPRATTPAGTVALASDWTPVGVTVRRGASIGARSVCVAPVTIGRWAMVGAGAVVVHDVPDFALVVGNPARQIGWVGHAGRRLDRESSGTWRCPVTGMDYVEESHGLRERDK